METSIFSSIVILILCALCGLASLIFLVVGIIQKKQNWWMGGSIGFALALILSVVIILSNVVKYSGFIRNRINEEMSKENLYRYDTAINQQDDSTIDLVDSNFSRVDFTLPGNGKIQLEIFECRNFIANSLGVEKIDFSKDVKYENKDAVECIISMETAQRGVLIFELLDINDKKVAEYDEKVNWSGKSEEKIVATFNKMDWTQIKAIVIDFSPI